MLNYQREVLILVLVDLLSDLPYKLERYENNQVLILVLVDLLSDSSSLNGEKKNMERLNPCFSGLAL